ELSSEARTNLAGDLSQSSLGYQGFRAKFGPTSNNVHDPLSGLDLREIILDPDAIGNGQLVFVLDGMVQPQDVVYVRFLIQPGNLTYTKVGCYGGVVGATFAATCNFASGQVEDVYAT